MVKDVDKSNKYKELDKVSSSFCLAKWLQVTIDLKHGTNHSCHHPQRHIIPTEELLDNPGSVHNTKFKKRQRKMMLEGVRPPECSYCWAIEDTPGDHHSDRYVKSTDDWAYPSLEKIKSLPWDSNVNPTYIEVMFDSICNLSCSYCMADISTSIEKEMEEFGPYEVSDPLHRMPQHQKRKSNSEKENVYQQAFWKWLPTLKDDLLVLRITGGEPFLSPQNDKLLDFFEENPFPKLSLVINTNLSLPSSLIKKQISKIQGLIKNGKIKKFELYTSLDTFSEQASYIRSGLSMDLFWKNLDVFFEEFPGISPVIMCAFNILSIGKIEELLKKVLLYKRSGRSLVLDMSYLKNPSYLRANILSNDLKTVLEKSFSFMKTNTVQNGFSEHELSKFKMVYHWAIEEPEKIELIKNRRDFYVFINEYDRRKGSNFLETFPDYKSFYKICEKIYKVTK